MVVYPYYDRSIQDEPADTLNPTINAETNKAKTFIISFKFSEYYLQISHKHIDDIGKFAIFCLRAFRDTYSINQISQITSIDSDTIERQLNFLIEKSYINNNFELCDNGKQLLKIYDLIDKNNNIIKPIISFDHYIRNVEYKKIYSYSLSVNSDTSIANEPTGTVVEPLIYPYKIESLFEKIATETDQIISYLSSIFPDYEELIQENSDEFNFKLLRTGRTFYYNKKTNIEEFKELLTDKNDTFNFAIPIREYKTSISSIDELNEDEKSNIEKWIRNTEQLLNYSVSLFDDSKIDTSSIDICSNTDKAFELPKIFDGSSYLERDITMPLSIFFHTTLNKSFKDSYYFMSMNNKNFNKLLGEQA